MSDKPATQSPVEIAADIVELASSSLFDAAWYLASYPTAEGDPLVHFCNGGWRRGLRPNFYFDTNRYLAENADVQSAGINPLLHYLVYGEAENRPASYFFDIAWYRKTYNIPPAQNCLADYLRRRLAEPVSPHPGFDPGWYAAAYPASRPRQDLFEEYATRGPPGWRDPSNEARLIRNSGIFNNRYYFETYPAVAKSGLHAVCHFCGTGWRANLNPNPVFDTAWYLAQNQDVQAAGINPLFHYIAFGEQENRWPSADFNPELYRETHQLGEETSSLVHHLQQMAEPSRGAPAAGGDAEPANAVAPMISSAAARGALFDNQLIEESGLLDSNYYLISYPDVRESTLAPAEHFSAYGWQEGRRPNPYFDPAWYAKTQLAGAPVQNPLLHYIKRGERSGRRPIAYFDPAWYRREYHLGADEMALAHFLRHRRSQGYSPTPWFDVAAYMRAYGTEIGGNRDPFAHYLRVGIAADIDPGRNFNAGQYRRANMARPPPRPQAKAGAEIHEKLRREALNPLVHFLLSEAATSQPGVPEVA